MSLRPEQIADAVGTQNTAAHDPSDHVRVVAGPGTGKSATIEKRVCYLLDAGIEAKNIAAISFTRAAARDLGLRIRKTGAEQGLSDIQQVAVSTLHALALRALRRAGVLSSVYPADPVVLQRWELRNIFDAEFGDAYGVKTLKRREEIRRDREAFWSTGSFEPPNVLPPDPPITASERKRFETFHGPRTRLYSCVLPGEIVAQCVTRMESGTLDLVDLLGLTYLIIDEFQDLNPMDLRFVHALAEQGAKLFVAGDDDQSLYAFRYATPRGIEQFPTEREGCGDHTLSKCFRCAPAVLDAAQSLIRSYATADRIEKNLSSLWADADPAVAGSLGCWSFATGETEATAIARSCEQLISAGMNPRDIMILVASTRHPAREIHAALEEDDVPFSRVREHDITDTDPGRAGYALLSIVIDPMNYVACRTLLGVQKGVGVSTCNAIAKAVIDNNRNFRDLFYSQVPDGLLSARGRKAVQKVADICAELSDWSKDEAIGDRLDDVCALVEVVCGDEDATEDLAGFLSELPIEMTLSETHSYLGAGSDDDRRRVLTSFAARLELPEPDMSLVPDRVQVLTMHSAKGLSAQVVFIPGLEQNILPGEKRAPYPGLVQEAARMLYVSITRARVACALSFARRRFVNGSMINTTPSEFATRLGKSFATRTENGISEAAAKGLVGSAGDMS